MRKIIMLNDGTYASVTEKLSKFSQPKPTYFVSKRNDNERFGVFDNESTLESLDRIKIEQLTISEKDAVFFVDQKSQKGGHISFNGLASKFYTMNSEEIGSLYRNNALNGKRQAKPEGRGIE